jgi:hypothetical protein
MLQSKWRPYADVLVGNCAQIVYNGVIQPKSCELVNFGAAVGAVYKLTPCHPVERCNAPQLTLSRRSPIATTD